MMRRTGFPLGWALASALALSILSACQLGGGTEDTNDVQVSGRLLDPKGKPAPDAWVILYRAGEDAFLAKSVALAREHGLRGYVPTESTITDRGGYFRFRRVSGGTYSLQGGFKSGAALVYLPMLEVKGGSSLHLSPLVLETPAFLQGAIEGSWKAARAVLDGSPYRSGVDSSGRFLFPAVAPGRYLLRIFATPDGFPEREAAQRSIVLVAGDSLDLPPLSVQLAMQWTHRSRVGIDTANLRGEALGDFPLLLRLEGEGFPDAAGPGGQDIRFSGLDGSLLAYEVERWDVASRKAAFWIRMDSLPANASLWMYWGHAAAGPMPSDAVFDSAGHAGVWHLGQDPTTAPPQMQDASGRLNHATVQGAIAPAAAEGVAGGALAFSGTDQFLVSAVPQKRPDAFTLSLWFRSGAQNPGGKLAGLESQTTGLSVYFDRQVWLDASGRLYFGIYSPAPAIIAPADSPYVRPGAGGPADPPGQVNIQRILKSPAAYADGAWHHVAATLSSLGQCLYVDGALVAADPAVTQGAGFTGYWKIGGGTLRDWVGAPASGKENFQGTLDEVSIARMARNEAWIRLAYLTQRPDAPALSIAPEY